MGMWKNMNEIYKAGGSPLSKEGRENKEKMIASVPGRMAAAQEMLAQHTRLMTLAATGADATALVLDATQTGQMINSQPVIDFELQITRPGLPPYPLKVSQPVPQLFLSKIQGGTNIAVKVDPADPESVFLDLARS